ncbi:hypothetical protein E0Z10_g6202 [Xylaria hypoxylon]|uniref:Uncharacterized protein n=1 Tax=Xylaria hypoxylon TaxID=37992 RepID=A0A4Z0YTT4_9PEZI|nr:hypothetical protein E0Z10_g6202 [Xylaria hypoxylon]
MANSVPDDEIPNLETCTPQEFMDQFQGLERFRAILCSITGAPQASTDEGEDEAEESSSEDDAPRPASFEVPSLGSYADEQCREEQVWLDTLDPDNPDHTKRREGPFPSYDWTKPPPVPKQSPRRRLLAWERQFSVDPVMSALFSHIVDLARQLGPVPKNEPKKSPDPEERRESGESLEPEQSPEPDRTCTEFPEAFGHEASFPSRQQSFSLLPGSRSGIGRENSSPQEPWSDDFIIQNFLMLPRDPPNDHEMQTISPPAAPWSDNLDPRESPMMPRDSGTRCVRPSGYSDFFLDRIEYPRDTEIHPLGKYMASNWGRLYGSVVGQSSRMHVVTETEFAARGLNFATMQDSDSNTGIATGGHTEASWNRDDEIDNATETREHINGADTTNRRASSDTVMGTFANSSASSSAQRQLEFR